MGSKYTSAKKILDRISLWETKQETHVNSMSNEDAYKALIEEGLTEEQIKQKSLTLLQNGQPSEYRFQASYGDLHGIFHLDNANKEFDLTNNPKAAIKRAIFQCMEIAVLNIQDLSPRIAEDIKNNELGRALEKFGWVSDLSETLNSLSSIEREIPSSGKGIKLTIKDHSAVAKSALKDLEDVLYKSISDAGLITEQQLEHGLSNPATKFMQQGSINQTYKDVWANKTINIPGVTLAENQDEKDFYKRFVGTEHINLAVNEITQKGDNFLKQFKAFHQISEVLVNIANKIICNSIKTIVSDSSLEKTEEAIQNTDIALSLLRMVPENIKPILSNLGVKQYEDIRGSLGITSGSFSNNVRDGLFQPLHELFFQAVYVKTNGLNSSNYEPDKVQEKLNGIYNNPSKDMETSQNYRLANQAMKLDVFITDWRNLHLQLVKTQIGVNSSISGGLVGIKSANSFVLASEKIEFTLPIYKASGIEAPKMKSTEQIIAELSDPNTFVGKVATTEAKFVAKYSDDVNKRVGKKHEGGSGCPFH